MGNHKPHPSNQANYITVFNFFLNKKPRDVCFSHGFFSINKNQKKQNRGKENGPLIGSMNYEELLAEGDPMASWDPPKDEWDSLSLCYTSGTTADPKGAPNGYKKRTSEWKDVRVEMFVCVFFRVFR